MQTIDQDKQTQIQRLIENDADFRRLHEEHQDLHRRIEALRKRRPRTTEEEALLTELKKHKLGTKDALGRMLFEDEFRRRS